jgi:hypothetical protein
MPVNGTFKEYINFCNKFKNKNSNNWEDIETAPKDGSLILLYGGFFSAGKPSVRIGRWTGVRQPTWRDEALGNYPREPTHWMPLPLPPN